MTPAERLLMGMMKLHLEHGGTLNTLRETLLVLGELEALKILDDVKPPRLVQGLAIQS